MFIQDAYADETITVTEEGTGIASSASQMQSGIMNFVPFIMIFIIFYFMLIRPQVKKQKEHQNLLNTLNKGEKIVTSGGIIGTISKIEDDNKTVLVEIAPEVKIKLLKSNIAEVLDRKTAEITKS